MTTPTRIICLDTETTGLSPANGDRIIELGCIELIDRTITDKTFHYYLNPEGKSIDEGAQKVHGISSAFLEDKPTFSHIATDFLNFIQGAELVIHNAPFDVGFLNSELSRLGLKPLTIVGQCMITDTLALAKTLYPGKRNSLDGLCDRFAINRSNRTLHGALLDARLLADVYLNLTRSQDSLDTTIQSNNQTLSNSSINHTLNVSPSLIKEDMKGIVFIPNDVDYETHTAYLQALDKESKGATVWNKIL